LGICGIMTSPPKLKSPFPYFGSKRKVAPIIWQGLGYVANYVEPFAGSLAVLLNNPQPPKIETVNDSNHFLANFWRAISIDPELVSKYADYPVNEVDLHSRHQWLVSNATDEFRAKMESDPDYYDAKIAGWWAYGMAGSIPGNWMQTRGLNSMPMLSSAGGGIHGLKYEIPAWFQKLSQRLRRTRVACGDWSRVVSPAITYKNKGLVPRDITGIVLDPPYALTNRTAKLYQQDEEIFDQVKQWAIDNGDNPKLRIVLCGYEDDANNIPNTWQTYHWKTVGGMANQAKKDSQGKTNAAKETIWFSPHCLKIQEEE
jgi:DNA adenine methylase